MHDLEKTMGSMHLREINVQTLLETVRNLKKKLDNFFNTSSEVTDISDSKESISLVSIGSFKSSIQVNTLLK
jgi:hypothetical protein